MNLPAVESGFWALVPAAGGGTRMRAACPKQYLPVRGRAVILHTLERLCSHARLQGVVVGLAPGDTYWSALNCRFPRLLGTFEGGGSRALTVLNGLRVLARHAKPEDWVLVHDAARPCLRHSDIDNLIRAIGQHDEGAVLGVPITDTLKRADEAGHILETVARTDLWRALTPQIFRLGSLARAIERALKEGITVTDEASAMEYVGIRPRLVAGHPDNIKITLPDDLALAELYLRRQAGEGLPNEKAGETV
ncbi:MAG TPA: 2-C-methyl-D-erythritol 4-phosphate cytidylyltransferase [Acidiferrobacterales bacterium]|nr:2-C-methyl-D-erythritol 4-phosphate cytidylyltransferase [Acidiferrobacterales bacterium]